ncbi:hypothetical protein AVEN_86626-1 [Araneus ventricosus]|uniref:Uncharacterized protein n=1 Tax=Araneus ventricosus TaxID=182803 RepID=A0A4Y2HVJ3_ARAVE|nr:hypothetical protein AVEN_86626-1 [Araneus ventricosus]
MSVRFKKDLNSLSGKFNTLGTRTTSLSGNAFLNTLRIEDKEGQKPYFSIRAIFGKAPREKYVHDLLRGYGIPFYSQKKHHNFHMQKGGHRVG